MLIIIKNYFLVIFNVIFFRKNVRNYKNYEKIYKKNVKNFLKKVLDFSGKMCLAYTRSV